MKPKHIAVIGGGIVGALSAYYLDRLGARVTLLEAGPQLAGGASGMNGAQLSWSYGSPLGSPAIFGLLHKVVLNRTLDVKVTKWRDPELIAFGLALLAQSTRGRYKANQARLLDLALESRDLMARFRAEHRFDFHHAATGKLHLYVSREQMETARAFAGALAARGIRQEFLSPEDCVAREPALSRRKGPLAGGMFSAGDETGDCGLFTRALPALFSPGVTCRTATRVRRIAVKNGAFSALELENGERLGADAVLVAAGADSPRILATAGAKLRLYPVKGYALSFTGAKLTASVTDHHRRAVFAPLDSLVRMAGFMHFSGHDAGVTVGTRTALLNCARSAFPQAEIPTDVTIETGFRPYTPDSVPVTGPTRIKGLFLNTGHAMLGWTLAHATAKRAAEAVLSGQGCSE